MSNASEKKYTRRDFFKITSAFGAAAGFAATLSACAPKGNDTSSPSTGASAGSLNKDGTITAAISYELGTNGYDPMSTTAALTVAANWHTMEGLTELNPTNGEPYAALAKELPKSEGKSIDVMLRDGAKFHDGTPVTADDVVFSFERVLDKANKSLYASFIPFIEKVTKKDDKTVTFTLSEETGVFASRLAVVKIVPKAAVQANLDKFAANPIGSGAYKMTDNGGTSKTIKFERFEDYNGPKPALAKNMVWQIIPDASTRTNAIQSKTVQAIDSIPYLSIEQLKSSSSVESVQGFGLLFAMFNNDKSNPFSDVKNRQAFLYGVNINQIIETALLGQASPVTSFLHKEHPQYHEAKVQYAYDAEKAKKLFAETGLKELRMLCTDHDWVKKCTPLIQESLSAIGIKVDFTEKKSSDVYNTIDGKPEAYDVVIAPGDPSVFGLDPDLLMRWWYAGDTWTESRMHWKGTPEYTKLQEILDAGLKSTNATEQKNKWNEALDLISENVPLYPLFHRKVPTAWDASSLVDFKPISLTGLNFVGVGSTK
ncbi:ABC transporter substrate-binding protein [Corynebacterium ulcerans]|uniref:Oligopeptide-binding protein OppA n=2 Tax=Corynebacterium TaxID=1716 RepID=A0ABD7MV18_CORUL|nr:MULTISPECIES: ABC transporter substrate-binding protein [Corynebacterium]AEG82669.1 putative secreted protein [Corynebacterium ulcerans 809]AEG85004.1 putative secreted protein [Corynebacterium ulcerans BR-AD22]AIT90192.1 Oligopeptide-binding protein oppA [Corynebacterium ulcerans]AIU31550.1 Oligopeptide-binding protein oppA [Corynebacterium ulcerans]AIU33711.1 Oligopeptide-binding protein oppA [Corynebacterium ramonii FRC0011]